MLNGRMISISCDSSPDLKHIFTQVTALGAQCSARTTCELSSVLHLDSSVDDIWTDYCEDAQECLLNDLIELLR